MFDTKKIEDLRYYSGNTSVTSVLKWVLPQPAFITMWIERAENSENPEEELAKIDETMHNACVRGSYVHRFLEEYFKGNMKFYHEDPKVLAYVNGAINFLNAYGKDLEPLMVGGKSMVEMPLICDDLKLAGTPDLPCLWKGEKIMVDYKTASTPKLNEDMLYKYKLQMAALVKLSETLYPEHEYDKAIIQVLTDKRKNGIGEQYMVDREELLNLWLEYEVYLNQVNKELENIDRSTLKDYLKEDRIMAMDRKI